MVSSNCDAIAKSTRKKSQQCAARVMEAVPLVMRFIRADMRAINATDMSVPQFRTLAFLDRNPGASLSELAEHLGVTRATASANTEVTVPLSGCDPRYAYYRSRLKASSNGLVRPETLIISMTINLNAKNQILQYRLQSV